MSTFSDLNDRLAAGLLAAQAAIVAKNGEVSIANDTPQIEEIVVGIQTITGSSTPTEMGTSMLTMHFDGEHPSCYTDPSLFTTEIQGVLDLTYPISFPDFVWADSIITTFS